MKARDTQRSKLYEAEKVLDTLSVRCPEMPDVIAYVGKVRSNTALKRRYGRELHREIRIKDGRRQRSALAWVDTISMPRWSRTQYIILHELAHVVAQRKWDHPGTEEKIAGHGVEFCAVYVDLVRYMMGAQAARVLKESFKRHKVKWIYRRPSKDALDRARWAA